MGERINRPGRARRSVWGGNVQSGQDLALPNLYLVPCREVVGARVGGGGGGVGLGCGGCVLGGSAARSWLAAAGLSRTALVQPAATGSCSAGTFSPSSSISFAEAVERARPRLV